MIQFFLGLAVGLLPLIWIYCKAKSTKKEWWEEGLPPPEFDPDSDSQT